MSAISEEDTTGSNEEGWIDWFCGLTGNQFYCVVERSFIEDNFNLFGLRLFLPDEYDHAYKMLLDRLEEADSVDIDKVSRAASLLYGMIHARYIITASGLEQMRKKYKDKKFGECPRSYCRGQAVVPMGVVDEPKKNCIKLFCPRCKDIYNCPSQFRHIDGAYFGPTFPHLLFMTYDEDAIRDCKELYVPRVFGFKVAGSRAALANAQASKTISEVKSAGSQLSIVSSSSANAINTSAESIKNNSTSSSSNNHNNNSSSVVAEDAEEEGCEVMAKVANVANSGKTNTSACPVAVNSASACSSSSKRQAEQMERGQDSAAAAVVSNRRKLKA